MTALRHARTRRVDGREIARAAAVVTFIGVPVGVLAGLATLLVLAQAPIWLGGMP